MCGIAGIISPDPDRVGPQRLQAMADALSHRGPDGEGLFRDTEGPMRLGFAHRRLAILDRSDAAAQPFNFDGRYTIIHNGELYNHLEIRESLEREGVSFRSHGDTEVIVAAYARWGSECLSSFDGMFAFAIWDRQEKSLFLARDRFGEKPLLYHFDEQNGELHFASEAKALGAAGVPLTPDHQMVFQYLTQGIPYLPGELSRTFHEGIAQLPPASFLRYDTRKGLPWIERYWDLDKLDRTAADEVEAQRHFRELLDRSIERRLRSDVPVGTSLSGGLDSSSILAGCKTLGGASYAHHSFSAVFPGFARDESESIVGIARAFGIDPTLTEPTAEDLLQHIATVVRHQELPPSSASVFAQYAVFGSVSNTAVKVLLDGQGADETLGGYRKYAQYFLQECLSKQRFGLARKESLLLRQNGFLEHWGPLNLFAAWLPGLAAHRLEQRAVARQRHQQDINLKFPGFQNPAPIHKPVVATLNDILYADTLQGGLQELLHYADRNSMAFGREVRLPFLSHELVEFAFSLPSTMKMRDGYSKWILRAAQEDRLPSAVTWRKGKIGFEPPQRQWMEHRAVQAAVQSAKEKLRELGILNDLALQRKVTAHDAYEANGMDWRYWMVGLLL